MYIIFESKEDIIQNYVDILDTVNLSVEKRNLYVKKLKDLGYIYKDKDLFSNIDLNNILTLNDFPTYESYKKYAELIFKKRNYHSDLETKCFKNIGIDAVRELLSSLNVNVEYKKYYNSIDLASSDGSIINMPEKLDKYSVIHELGHVIQRKQRYINGILLDICYSPSEYGLQNAGECFAENFAHYVCDKNYKKTFSKSANDIKKLGMLYISKAIQILNY